MISRFDSKTPCVNCHGKMHEGEEIRKQGAVWVHNMCELKQIKIKLNPLNSYQDLAAKALVETEDNLIIDACAGSGKTYTIMEMVKRISIKNPTAKICYLVFNKSMQAEASSKFLKAGLTAEVSTFHSIGFRAFKKVQKCKLDTDKTWGITEKCMPNETSEDKKLRNKYTKLISLHKNTLLSAEDINNDYDLEIENLDFFPEVLRRSNLLVTSVDFDDMVYFPTIMASVELPRYDYIFIDEAQDLNPARMKLIKKFKKARLIFVGDERQAIYGFCGADKDSMRRIRKLFKCKQFFIPETYRCGKEIVKEIKKQNYHENFLANDNNPEGQVKTVIDCDPNPGDLILCRFNAPIISLAFKLLGEGKAAKVLGRDLTKEILALVKRLEATSLNDLQDKLNKYKEATYKRYERVYAKRPSVFETMSQQLEDKVEIIITIAGNCDEISQFKDKFMSIFDTKSKNPILLSSIHRAKGQEASKVWVLQSNNLPLNNAQQEINLAYVAYSRAIKELNLVEN